jgi:hypothetical protein
MTAFQSNISELPRKNGKRNLIKANLNAALNALKIGFDTKSLEALAPSFVIDKLYVNMSIDEAYEVFMKEMVLLALDMLEELDGADDVCKETGFAPSLVERLKSNPNIALDAKTMASLEKMAWSEMAGTAKQQKADESKHNPYDKVFSLIKTMSHQAIIMFLNAIFDSKLDPASDLSFIDYMPDESELYDDSGFPENFSSFLAFIDEGHKFHIVLEEEENPNLAFEMLKYGIMEALDSAEIADEGDAQGITIPVGAIICLEDNSEMPDSYAIDIRHRDSVLTCTFRVIKLAACSLRDLIDNGLIALVPLYPTQFRNRVEKLSNEGNLQHESGSLKKAMFFDAVAAIKERLDNGTIDRIDAQLLVSNTICIYNHLYSGYDEMMRCDMKGADSDWLAPFLSA